jgi:hypothetical protein
MRTIEDCQAEIEQKAAVINQNLGVFRDNISKIGQWSGKDPQTVYNKLTTVFDTTMETYRTTTRQNVEILSSYVTTLDSIIVVLDDIMQTITELDTQTDTTKNAAYASASISSAADKVDALVGQAANAIAQAAAGSGVEMTPEKINWIKMGVAGAAVYLVGGMLGLGGLVRTGAAVGAAFWAGKPKSP